jgi:hypothetical protein
MRLVLARVRWWLQRKRRGDGSAKCPIAPLHRIGRAHIRWAIRRHGKSAIQTVALLRADVRLFNAAGADHEEAILRATAVLCAEVAAEAILAFGRPGEWRSRQFKSGTHVRIPPEFFANPNNTILPDGWATCGWDTTARDWADWNGPEWGDVRFRRDEVLALVHEDEKPNEWFEVAVAQKATLPECPPATIYSTRQLQESSSGCPARQGLQPTCSLRPLGRVN